MLLPVRNALPYLGDCLDDLAAQTLADFEVVAVDDGSDDGSSEILAEQSRRDPRFRYIRIEPSGLIAALNQGLSACRADLVARMDADDRCDPRRLELQVARLVTDSTLTVVVSLIVVNTSEKEMAERESGTPIRRFLGERYVACPLLHSHIRSAIDARPASHTSGTSSTLSRLIAYL